MARENEGGIRRGDRADTGDLEARRTEGTGPGGSGVPGGAGGSTGNPTAAADALDRPVDNGIAEIHGDTELEELSVHGASDPDLGMTNIGSVPADDWAADTGPTRTGESSSHGVGRRLIDADGSLIPDADAEGRPAKPRGKKKGER
jgi:hypothetical protein